MALPIPGFPAGYKVPGFYISIAYGQTPTGAGATTRKALIYANRITSDITGSAPSFTVNRGTQPQDASPVEIFNADTAATLYGRGSEAHRMVKSFLRQAPGSSVTVVTTAESGGARASAVLTFASTATAAFTVRLIVCGTTVDVSVASGDTPTVIATACATALLAEPDLPVTAQFLLGVLTLTAKHPGPRGNGLSLQAFFVSASNIATQIGSGGTSSSGAATTGILSGTSSVGALSNVFQLTGGTTADTVTAALASVNSALYDMQASAHRDATAVDAILTQLYLHSAPLVGLYEQLVVGTTDSQATATTLATGRNRELCQVVNCPYSPTPAEEIAAQQMAMRIYGDAAAGGQVVGEASDPASNLIGGRHATTQAPASIADNLSAASQQAMLSNGVTPLVPSGVSNGVQCVRSITTKSVANGAANYSTLDTKTVTVPQFAAKDLKSFLATKFAGYKLGADLADGTPPRQARVTSIRGVYDTIRARLFDYEQGNDGLPSITINTETNCGEFGAPGAGLVVQAGAVAGFLTAYIPCQPIPDLAGVAAQLNQL